MKEMLQLCPGKIPWAQILKIHPWGSAGRTVGGNECQRNNAIRLCQCCLKPEECIEQVNVFKLKDG